ncbi:hypothetical protein MGN70_005784 [Eutypa lata]|nr:hypothetical protein MGN70_005784 [Eutypa lata]
MDVLINNAGAITLPNSDDPTDIRKNWAEGFDCLLTSNVLVTKAFMPLLRKAEWGRVIMVSSTRGSLAKNKANGLPPPEHWLYGCSKAALNLATIEFRNEELREVADEKDRVTFWAVCPGYCKTGLNGFKGFKDPVEGAAVTARLLGSRRGEILSGTFWGLEKGNFGQIPW